MYSVQEGDIFHLSKIYLSDRVSLTLYCAGGKNTHTQLFSQIIIGRSQNTMMPWAVNLIDKWLDKNNLKFLEGCPILAPRKIKDK